MDHVLDTDTPKIREEQGPGITGGARRAFREASKDSVPCVRNSGHICHSLDTTSTCNGEGRRGVVQGCKKSPDADCRKVLLLAEA